MKCSCSECEYCIHSNKITIFLRQLFISRFEYFLDLGDTREAINMFSIIGEHINFDVPENTVSEISKFLTSSAEDVRFGICMNELYNPIIPLSASSDNPTPLPTDSLIARDFTMKCVDIDIERDCDGMCKIINPKK